MEQASSVCLFVGLSVCLPVYLLEIITAQVIYWQSVNLSSVWDNLPVFAYFTEVTDYLSNVICFELEVSGE